MNPWAERTRDDFRAMPRPDLIRKVERLRLEAADGGPKQNEREIAEAVLFERLER